MRRWVLGLGLWYVAMAGTLETVGSAEVEKGLAPRHAGSAAERADGDGLPWRAAAGSVVITPEGPMWMGGYASRDKPSEGTAQDLYAKVLLVEDRGGRRLAIVTCDLLAVTPLLRGRVVELVGQHGGLDSEHLLMNASHTHCGPELRPPQAARRGRGKADAERARRYTLATAEKIAAMIERAIARLQPARLIYSHARAGFAMNRRLPTDRGVINSPNPDGPVDHDVPVLQVRDSKGKLIAVLFGYACHNTTIGFFKFCGDYAGYAQQYVEQAHLGATALFLAGCGGDQNPYPRGTLEHAQQHGRALANAVETALLTRRARDVCGPLRVAMGDVMLKFAPPPSREELQRRLASANRYERSHAQRLLAQLDRDGAIRTEYAFPLQVARFGDDLMLIALCGEAVVDYALRFKRELRPGVSSTIDGSPVVWVAGYSNHVFGYLPSLRVLREGGYEGARAMLYTDYPGPFEASVEDRVVAKVRELVERVSQPPAPSGRRTGIHITVRVELGRDLGQNFGTLFEGRDDMGRLRLGAGFLGVYNTRYRGDRYKVHFFVRSLGDHQLVRERLPRATADSGIYLYGLGGDVYAESYGRDALPRRWSPAEGRWVEVPPAERSDPGATIVRGKRLCLRDSRIVYNDRVILDRPARGSYTGLYYGQGFLFFYHRFRPDTASGKDQSRSRSSTARDDGAASGEPSSFNRIYAVPWDAYEATTVDLSRAEVLEPEFVREFPYGYGQLGSEVLNCSNVGGLYAFDVKKRRWRVVVRPLDKVSYQIYSMINYYDRLLMGHYPTGVLLQYDGQQVATLTGWPPVPEGVSPRAREAQTTTIYGGQLFVGVWPWAELWRLDPDDSRWLFVGRMFSHPAVTDKTVHPYESLPKEIGIEGGSFGQRVTSLVPYEDALLVGTSSKRAGEWNEQAARLFSPDERDQYGAIYRLTQPANLAATIRWTEGPTTLRFVAKCGRMAVYQDGEELVGKQLDANLLEEFPETRLTFGRGLFGPFTGKVIPPAD